MEKVINGVVIVRVRVWFVYGTFTQLHDNDNQPHKKRQLYIFGGKRKCKDAFMHCYYVWYFYNNSILLSGSQSHTLKQTR